jgi:hypothetical protein
MVFLGAVAIGEPSPKIYFQGRITPANIFSVAVAALQRSLKLFFQ